MLPSRSRSIPPTPPHQGMDYLPFPSSSSSSSSSSSEQSYKFVVSAALGRVIRVTVTCLFALVGSSAGAVTGAFIGIATESGLLRGAGVGAISGAVFSIEVVESSLDLWNSRESGIWSILYVLDVISSILSGRLVRDKVGPALQNAVQSEMSALSLPFPETPDIFETGGIRGLELDEVEKLPVTKIAPEDNLEAGEEKICCSVCLQDFQVGEKVRKLPHCQHMFHLPCIDSWLIRHGTCPMCRRDV